MYTVVEAFWMMVLGDLQVRTLQTMTKYLFIYYMFTFISTLRVTAKFLNIKREQMQ